MKVIADTTRPSSRNQSRNRLTKAASELRAYSDELDGIRDRLCNPLGDHLDGR